MAFRFWLAVLTLAFTAAALSALLSVYAQPSENEARRAFEGLGCTSCHNGQVASRWDEIVSHFKSWGGKYASLDEAVRAEVTYFGMKFNSFDELMKTMATNVGRQPSDPQVVLVRDFLVSLFEAGEATPTTPQPTTPQTPPTTPGVTEGVRGGERLGWGVILAAIAIAAIVLGALVAALIVVRR